MAAAKSELSQMHNCARFKAIVVAKLSRRERLCAQEGLILLTRKKSGEAKGCLVYNDKQTRNWISREDKSSPTVLVLAESLMFTCTIDAFERRDIMTLDIPNAYIQASVPLQQVEDRIIMKVRGNLVE